MSSAFACPHCRNVIQTAAPVPAGKQVKCPNCKGYFLAPPMVMPPLPVAPIVSASPHAMPPPLPQAAVMPPPPPVAMMPPPIPHKKHKKDRKHRRHRHRHGSGRGLNTGGGLIKILVGVVGLFLLMGLSAGAYLFFMPGGGNVVATDTEEEPTEIAENTKTTETKAEETKATEKATKATETKTVTKKDPPPKKKDPPAMKGPEDPLVLVPASSAAVIGADLKKLAEVPAFKGLLAGPLAKLSEDLKRDAGMDLAGFAESATIALHGSTADLANAKVTLILKSQAAFDPSKLAGSPAVAGKAEVKGRTYYQLKPDSGLAHGRKDALLFASDRLLVLSDLPKADFEKLIGGELAKLDLADARELQQYPLWAYVPLDDGLKTSLQAGLLADKAPAELKPAATALAGASGLGLWAIPAEEVTLLAAGLFCANEAAAKEAVDGFTAFWKILKMPNPMMAKLPPEIGKLAAEFRAGAEFSYKGRAAVVRATLPIDPLAGLLASGEAGVKAAYPQLLAGLAPPPPLTLSKEEQLVQELVNKAREGEKLPALKINPTLMKMARDHAANMAKQEKSEDLLDGKDHVMRLTDAGYKIKDKMSQANLVSADAAVLKDATIAVGAWLGDDASKANILGKYTETGIGVAISDKKIAYYYQVFAVPEE